MGQEGRTGVRGAGSCSACIPGNFPCHSLSKSLILCLPSSAPSWETDYWQHLSPAALEQEASSGLYMPLCGQNSLASAACRERGDLMAEL